MERVFLTKSEEETQSIGERLAGKLTPGDAVLLTGELGAGKTVLARGIARGLGIDSAIKSPTFTIVREYSGRVKLSHFDLYRIENEDELFETGFETYLESSVCVIEWPEPARELLKGRVTDIYIEYAENGERRVTVRAPFEWSEEC